MKRLLIAYPAMMLGGSTTSLLSILYNLDYKKYRVDLLLAFNIGEWLDDIPSTVNILEPAYMYQDRRSRYIHRLLSPRYMVTKLISKAMEIRDGNILRANQYLEMKDVDFYRDIDEEYDIAISFLEGQTCKYVANHVSAKKKIAWIHVNYKDLGICAKYDRPSLEKYDCIVHVSEECKTSFNEMYPDMVDKCRVIENILSQKRIRKLSRENIELSVEPDCVNIVTTCRITYGSKGLDRAVTALHTLSNEERLLEKKIHWFIIGDGPDYEDLRRRIQELDLNDIITFLGSQKNPYKFYPQMDCFFLPSRYEGKPMAVTEALMLSLPVIATEYSSAHEQIVDGEDGKLFPNSEEGVLRAFNYILHHRDEIRSMKKSIFQKDYSNMDEMKKIEKLFEEKI